MNPYQQPQNTAPYGQNPGYPQQAGPNKYPTLPPIQNNQYPPQQPQYPGYNAQVRPAGYQPPAQYGNVQAQANIERERQEVLEKMAENDKGFNSCFLTFYKVWLWFLGIAAFGTFVYYVLALTAAGNINHLGDIWTGLLVILGWTFIQSVFGLKAMAQKSIRKANITCWMMVIGLIPSLIVDIFFIVALAQYPYPRPPPQHDWAPVYEIFIGLISTQLLVHIAISMNGAFKVRKILMEREVLQEKLNEIDYSFRA